MDDARIRLEAFAWLQKQQRYHGDVLSAELLRKGFEIDGFIVPLMGPSGIWKPKVLADLPLSITTTWNNKYLDRVDNEDSFVYSFRSGEHVQNTYLVRAAKRGIPLVYFHAVSKARYNCIYPAFITRVDEINREVLVQVGDIKMPYDLSGKYDLNEFGVRDSGVNAIKSYRTVEAKARIHQQKFREIVLLAYSRQCACCGFRHDEMLDAAHIIEDHRETGNPIVQNGLALCSLHHRAFDRNFIGIDSTYHITVRPDLMREKDGPTLEGIQNLNGNLLRVRPRSKMEWPDTDALEQRFKQFLTSFG